MGTWDTGSFDNDEALDWLDELDEAEEEDVITETLRAVAENPGYIEAPDAQRALAAAEVVAAMNGHPSPNLPETAAAWVEKDEHTPSKLYRDLARRAVERVRADSELKELWEEAALEEWNETIEDLTTRLSA